MNIRILVFGMFSGIVWSLIPGALSEILSPAGQAVTVFLSGAATGVVVSLFLSACLPRVSRKGRIFLAAYSLPVAAFTFGFLITLAHLCVEAVFGVSYRFRTWALGPTFLTPFLSGYSYASYSIILSPVLLPLAFFTSSVFWRLAFVGPLEATKPVEPTGDGRFLPSPDSNHNATGNRPGGSLRR